MSINIKIRALIVGLEGYDCTLANEVLSQSCANVISATSTASALEIFRKQPAQIVIVDSRPQNISAEDFIKALCNEDSEVLIVVTGLYQDENIINCLKSGASDFLTRPLSEEALSFVISRFHNIILRRSSRKFHAHLFNGARLELEMKSSVDAVNHGVAIISNFLTSACVGSELVRVELGIQELLRNSLEHGNLGIDYETKIELCANGKFDEYVKKQSISAEQQNKTIKITIELLGDALICNVKDSGQGFDWRAYQTSALGSADEGKFSGRGIVLISKIFDEINYNDSGNEVNCRKKLSPFYS